MCDLALYRENNTDSTAVSNCFIDEYLADANDAQIKVYLYLIRMTNAGRPTNISDIADKFNHTEKDICRALRYWEKKGLLSLDYDQNGGIVGLRMFDPTQPNKRSMPSNNNMFTPVMSIMSEESSSAARNSGMETVLESNADDTQKKYFKPDYSVRKLNACRKREDISNLIFIAEQYLKQPLSANDIKSIIFYTDELGLSEDVIDHMIQYCVDIKEKEKKSINFAYIDKVAITWAQNNISTVKEARAFIRSMGKRTSTGAASDTAQKSTVNYAQNTAPRKFNTSFHQIEQNTYDFAALEQRLLNK
ncbi:MAG: DnaD domain protein [Lachnospiraceae bacterium]|nr:DnaD domain protein [Lachnospiraceae bacterium]